MPKMKTKSSTKRRFRITAKGKVRANPAGKRHFLRRRSKRMLRQTRGTIILDKSDTKIIKSYMPYAK